MGNTAHTNLLKEMRRALLAEFGALAIYGHLQARTRDQELLRVLLEMEAEQAKQIEELREVMRALGAEPRRGSLRRRLLARLAAWSAIPFGLPRVLRLCRQAQTIGARWYAQYREHLVRIGELDLALACERLSDTKTRHANRMQLFALGSG